MKKGLLITSIVLTCVFFLAGLFFFVMGLPFIFSVACFILSFLCAIWMMVMIILNVVAKQNAKA